MHLHLIGAMAEWSNAAVLKTVIPFRVSGVQIPLAPYKSAVEETLEAL